MSKFGQPEIYLFEYEIVRIKNNVIKIQIAMLLKRELTILHTTKFSLS